MRIQVNGAEVFFSTGSGHPDAAAPTLIFLHGVGFDHSAWVMPARYFARHGMRVLAVDLPGHGLSGGAPLTSVTAMADWVVDLMQVIEVQQVMVVGHSMGSLIALALAMRHPLAVSKIALLGASAPMPVTNMLLAAAADHHHAAVEMVNIWSHSTQLGASANPGTSNVNAGERLLERAIDGVLHTDLAACNAFEFSLEQAAPTALSVESLVIAGDQDKMTPAKAGMLVAQWLPQARTCLLPGCGHFMLSEQPNEVLDELKTFIFSD